MSGWVDSFAPKAFEPKTVEAEGDYRLKIDNVTTGTMEAKPERNEGPKRYFKIECYIAAKGYPKISIFLTEGNSFDATATAFFDTFAISYGNWNIETWKGAEGLMHITPFNKNGYKDMKATYILNSEGRVMNRQAPMQVPSQPMPQQTMGNGAPDQFGNIPF